MTFWCECCGERELDDLFMRYEVVSTMDGEVLAFPDAELSKYDCFERMGHVRWVDFCVVCIREFPTRSISDRVHEIIKYVYERNEEEL